MHNGALKKMALALTFWLALHMSQLKAQIVFNSSSFTYNTSSTSIVALGPNTTSNPFDFEFRSDGTLIAKGSGPVNWGQTPGVGTLLSTDEGVGTRMLWYPARAAFRAGALNSNTPDAWDSANIGFYSSAFGLNTTASGSCSFSAGTGNTASGQASAAFGNASSSSGDFSFATGAQTSASGYDSTASGYNSSAIGSYSSAFNDSTARGTSAASFNNGEATGFASAAFGSATANAIDSFAVGIYNVGGGNPTVVAQTDPIFEVGNGAYNYTTETLVRSDAFVVHRDGTATFAGAVTIPQSGDIPMYTGN